MNKSIIGLLAVSAYIQATEAKTKRPNIVFIMADDLGYNSVGCYGNQMVHTPNIDKLSHEGVLLTDFHSNGAFSSPTRAALLTGRYQQRAAWVDDAELSPVFREQRKANIKQRWAWGISHNEITLAQVLQQSGYKTGLMGKWHLGYDFNFHPMNYGFDEFNGFVGGNVNYHTHIAYFGLKELDWWRGKTIENEIGYTTDLITKHSVDFIRRHQKEPFFLYVAEAAPHEPWQGRNKDLKKSDLETYQEMIEVLDESVGAIVKELKKNKLDKNTLIVFCSDNGPFFPVGFNATGKLQGKKGSLYEGGHRLPFIASWPGKIRKGLVSSETVMTMDMLPTFASIVGVALPNGHPLDGIDVSAVLFKHEKLKERILHWNMDGNWAVRKGDWKMIGATGKPTKLFNLKDDIAEVKNLNTTYPALLDSLTKLHLSWLEEVSASTIGKKE